MLFKPVVEYLIFIKVIDPLDRILLLCYTLVHEKKGSEKRDM